MPLQDISKPEIIQFLKESYEKTARLRLRWNNSYRGLIAQAAKFRGEEKGYDETSIGKTVIAGGLVAVTRDQEPAARNRFRKGPHDVPPKPLVADLRKEHTIPSVGLGYPKVDPRLSRPDADLSPDPIMRPVPAEVKKIIYDNSGFGLARHEYLTRRSKVKPEDRYYFAEDVNWDYGWRQKDSYFGRRGGPMRPKVAHLTKGGMSRSGATPDPTHYNPVA